MKKRIAFILTVAVLVGGMVESTWSVAAESSDAQKCVQISGEAQETLYDEESEIALLLKMEQKSGEDTSQADVESTNDTAAPDAAEPETMDGVYSLSTELDEVSDNEDAAEKIEELSVASVSKPEGEEGSVPTAEFTEGITMEPEPELTNGDNSESVIVLTEETTEEALEPNEGEDAVEDDIHLVVLSATANKRGYVLGEKVVWQIACEGAEALTWQITGGSGEEIRGAQIECEDFEGIHSEIAFEPEVSGCYYLKVRASYCEQTQSIQDEISVYERLNVEIQDTKRYGMAERKALQYHGLAIGGAAPYCVRLSIYTDGAIVFTDERKIDSADAFDFTYMPTHFGIHKAVITLTDTIGQTTDESISTPVSINEYEDQEDWEISARTELTGDWRDDLVAVARTQIGYGESEKNFIIDDDGKQQGYTRYGDWYGSSYAEWCAMFVSFCIHYSGVPVGYFPQEASCANWTKALISKGYYMDGNYVPAKGDLIFFSHDGDDRADHVGIVEKVDESAVYTIEGNVGKRVVRRTYAHNSNLIVGYASMEEAMLRAGKTESREKMDGEETGAAAEPMSVSIQFASWEPGMESIALIANANADGTEYQWERQDRSGEWVALEKCNGATLSIEATFDNLMCAYRCRVVTTKESEASDPIILVNETMLGWMQRGEVRTLAEMALAETWASTDILALDSTNGELRHLKTGKILAKMDDDGNLVDLETGLMLSVYGDADGNSDGNQTQAIQ